MAKKMAKNRILRNERYFPYEYIERGSNVVIYGLGELGENYISQLEITHWCNIVGISDKEDKSADFTYTYYFPNKLASECEFDYIVIAITRFEYVKEAYDYFVQMGISAEKIVTALVREGSMEQLCEKRRIKDSKLFVKLIMQGGIGDAVMETCFYSELIRMVPDAVIDIYGPYYNKAIYERKDNVRAFYDPTIEDGPKDYDLSMSISWGITVLDANMTKIENASRELYEKIVATDNDIKKNTNNLQKRLWQARLHGGDKFWLMGRGKIWNLSPGNISVDIDESFEQAFNELGLKKYITVNCGVDMRKIVEEWQFPTKIWPKKYFEEFIPIFKEKYPDYEVVQLGAKNQEPMMGADRHIFGKSLELTKYILMNSSIHIDDEGGLVHLATALGTKCVVLFGPTPMELLGYPQNINICTNVCQGCFCYVDDWNAYCDLGMKQPKCMYSITPEMVLMKVDEYLKSRGRG